MSEGNISHAIVLSLYFFTLLVHVYKKNCTFKHIVQIRKCKDPNIRFWKYLVDKCTMSLLFSHRQNTVSNKK